MKPKCRPPQSVRLSEWLGLIRCNHLGCLFHYDGGFEFISARHLPLVALVLPIFVVAYDLLERTDRFWCVALVCLVVAVCNEIRQRCLPRTCSGVSQTSEFLWIEAKFSRHLHRGVRKIEFPACFVPRLKVLRDSFRCSLHDSAQFYFRNSTVVLSSGQGVRAGADCMRPNV